MSIKDSRVVKKISKVTKNIFKKKDKKEELMDPATALALVLFILLLPVLCGAKLGKKK